MEYKTGDIVQVDTQSAYLGGDIVTIISLVHPSDYPDWHKCRNVTGREFWVEARYLSHSKSIFPQNNKLFKV